MEQDQGRAQVDGTSRRQLLRQGKKLAYIAPVVLVAFQAEQTSALSNDFDAPSAQPGKGNGRGNGNSGGTGNAGGPGSGPPGQNKDDKDKKEKGD